MRNILSQITKYSGQIDVISYDSVRWRAVSGKFSYAPPVLFCVTYM